MTDQNADLNTSELTSNVDVQCVECAEKIKLDARKCRHCGAYQRRHHRWSGPVVTILSLLVAIVSLVLGGIDEIRDLVHPKTPLFAKLDQVQGIAYIV